MAQAKRKAKEFPYRDRDQKALEDGQQVARARYYRSIDSTARDVLEEIAEDGRIDDESLIQRLDEEADSAVIYTRVCIGIMGHSDNWTAIEDVFGDDVSQWGATGVSDLFCKMAYFAYRADLEAQVSAIRDEYED